MGHIFSLDEGQESIDVEVPHEDDGTAVGEGRQQGDNGGVGIERRRQCRHAVRAEPVVREGMTQLGADTVAVQDSLRHAGGAGNCKLC